MNCPKCNAQMNGRFCPECGYDSSSTNQCPVCKAEIKSRFCENCGYDSQKREAKKSLDIGRLWGKAKAWVVAHKEACIAGALAILLVIGIIPVIAYFSSIYRVGVVSEVTVGMEKAQVENLLGEPTDKRDYKWAYYDSDILGELEELDAEMEEAFMSGDEEKLMELAEEYDRKSAELESETFEYIEVYFDSEGKVESVLFDTEKSYADEVEPKTLKQVDLALGSNSIDVQKLIIEDKIEHSLPNSFPSKVVYITEFEDGSWYSGYVLKSELDIEMNDSDVLLSWYDYSGNVKCSIAMYANVTINGRIENGILYGWPAEKGVLNIPDGVKEIYPEAFKDRTYFTSVTIPDSVTSIGNGAFRGCKNLTKVTIGKGVTSIGENAFYDCHKLVEIYNLSSLNITEGSDSYGVSALNVYTPLEGESKQFTTDDGFVFYDDGEARYFLGYIGDKTEITLPKSCNGNDYKIYKYAFYNYTSLTNVTIPSRVKGMGDCAFKGCTSLTNITIPDSVTSIGNEAFYGCTSITSITIPGKVKSIGNEAFCCCASLSNVTIPDSITSIGDGTFYGCESLTSITVPDSVTSIGEWAFSRCTNLTGITIPDSLTSISSYAFDGCTSLTSITIPDSITSIGNFAFSRCISLTSITIPDSVTKIDVQAFYGCESLTSVVFINTKGWKVENGGAIDVTDPSKNAELLLSGERVYR